MQRPLLDHGMRAPGKAPVKMGFHQSVPAVLDIAQIKSGKDGVGFIQAELGHGQGQIGLHPINRIHGILTRSGFEDQEGFLGSGFRLERGVTERRTDDTFLKHGKVSIAGDDP